MSRRGTPAGLRAVVALGPTGARAGRLPGSSRRARWQALWPREHPKPYAARVDMDTAPDGREERDEDSAPGLSQRRPLLLDLPKRGLGGFPPGARAGPRPHQSRTDNWAPCEYCDFEALHVLRGVCQVAKHRAVTRSGSGTRLQGERRRGIAQHAQGASRSRAWRTRSIPRSRR